MTGVSARLWERNAETVAQVLQTPWLRAMAQGSLETSHIERFLAVDEQFLSTYWRCLGLVSYVAETERVQDVLAALSSAILAELKTVGALRRRTEVSVTRSTQAPGIPTTEQSAARTLSVPAALLEAGRRYLRLLRSQSHALVEALANSSDEQRDSRETFFAEKPSWRPQQLLLVAALVPCMSLYAYLGRTLAEEQQTAPTGAPVHAVCRQWIEAYSRADFQERSRRLEQLLDSYVEAWCATSGETIDHWVVYLDTKAYAPAMCCEKELFAAASQE